MPFLDIPSYAPTAREFLAYWALVNAALVKAGGTVLVLPGPFGIADLQTLLADTEAAISVAGLKQSSVDRAIRQTEILREPLRERFKQLRRGYDAFLVGTPYERTLPLTPTTSTAGPNWVKPLQDAGASWANVNADTSLAGIPLPLTLAGGYTQEQFALDSAALIDSIQVRAAIPTALDPLLNARDALMLSLKARCVQFRAAVESQLASDDPLLKSLPAASPPKVVNATAVKLKMVFDTASGQNLLKWTSAASDTTRLQVRHSSGPRYKEGDSHSAADLAPEALQWLIPSELQPDGAMVWFKLISISETDNTAASNAVKA